jgi:hypothetical protein
MSLQKTLTSSVVSVEKHRVPRFVSFSRLEREKKKESEKKAESLAPKPL